MEICSTLFVVFLVLKLVGVITWSWWLVTMPIWLPLLIALTILAIVFIFGLISDLTL
jgi:hypothetical protein